MSESSPEGLPAGVIDPARVPARRTTSYPDPFKAAVAGREKRALGDAAGLRNFGVNLTRLEPGAASALRHWHERQDELVYVLEGEVTLVTDEYERVLGPGMAAGFPAGRACGHQLVNRSRRPALYLEIGDRSPEDRVHYTQDDLDARLDPAGRWRFTHKDGRPY
ncbi:MAG TPA: cupin domain-containing protein [Alphaproteobacteria bacterium]|nr:cupin domain-containing protein [Alphaproteobacteria bacterium]